jgi:hypothetical protein
LRRRRFLRPPIVFHVTALPVFAIAH